MTDDDHQRAIARRMVAHLREALDLEHVALALRLSREPTTSEFAERVRQRFRSDSEFRERVMAAAERAEGEELEAWRERCLPAPIEGAENGQSL
jgi:hypothetical protein